MPVFIFFKVVQNITGESYRTNHYQGYVSINQYLTTLDDDDNDDATKSIKCFSRDLIPWIICKLNMPEWRRLCHLSFIHLVSQLNKP